MYFDRHAWYNMDVKQSMRLVIVFGSRARETASDVSDWDVGVLGEHQLSAEEKADVAAQVARMLNVSEDCVDIVDLWSAPPLLQYRVAEEGKLLYGRESDFLRFRVRAWKRYQDTARLRNARKRTLAKRYAE